MIIINSLCFCQAFSKWLQLIYVSCSLLTSWCILSMTAIYHAKVFGRITMLKVWYLMQLGDGIDQDDKYGDGDDDV